MTSSKHIIVSSAYTNKELERLIKLCAKGNKSAKLNIIMHNQLVLGKMLSELSEIIVQKVKA